ncbi:hypothetical protein Pint_02167 [Pistacia integerrima]|uniref:Uncharacterized protein n=1 Tax=Pistacia integerrima TaxID=434235 RepID=A0ACC0ZL45_9ROSI|nr:hypothetical protein Pint_02167 [Pistacia integerrima]
MELSDEESSDNSQGMKISDDESSIWYQDSRILQLFKRENEEKPVEMSHEEAVRALGFDRISNLPNPLIHHIMSFLPAKDATRMGILSKKWESLWLTFPIFEFDEAWHHSRGTQTHTQVFLEHMQQSFSRRDSSHIQKLRIHTTSLLEDGLDQHITACITSALEGKVQEVHLTLVSRFNRETETFDGYILPKIIFSSGSSLVTLILEDCRCGAYDVVSFPSLKNLFMRSVHVSDRMLRNMISSSPQIHTVKLETCTGFDTLRVYNPKLRCLVVIRCKEIKALEIGAQSLNYFKYNGVYKLVNEDDGSFPTVSLCEISNSKVSNAKGLFSLETLVLSFVKITFGRFFYMLSRFPNLETMKLVNSTFGEMPSVLLEKLKRFEVENCEFKGLLEMNAPNLETLILTEGYRRCLLRLFGGTFFATLRTLSLVGYSGLIDDSLWGLLSNCLLENLNLKSCNNFKHIKVISSTMKSLVVDSCFYVEDGEIEAPKLVCFQYIGLLIEISPIISSSDLVAELHFQKPRNQIDDPDLITKFKTLLRNFEQAKSLTIISQSTKYVIIPEEEGKFPPLCFLRHLKVKTKRIDTSFLNLLFGVLRISFCRETLFISVGDITIDLKFELIPEAEEIDFVFCEWGIHECISNHLIEAKITNFDGNSNQIMEMLAYLLTRAQLLKNVTISLTEELPTKAPFNCPEVMIRRIMSYPKASKTAQISFE